MNQSATPIVQGFPPGWTPLVQSSTQLLPIPIPGMHMEVLTVFPFASMEERPAPCHTLYVQYRGTGMLTIDGVVSMVQETGLIVVPKGGHCAITNLTSVVLQFWRVCSEQPPGGSLFVLASLQSRLQEDVFHQTWLDQDRMVPRLAIMDAPGWKTLTLVELPPGARVESYVLQDAYESLYLFSGLLSVVAGEQRFDSDAGYGLHVLLSPGISRKIINRSSILPLVFFSLTIQEDHHGTNDDRTSH